MCFCSCEKVNKSSKATEKLLALAKKKLVSNCPSRWNSLFLLIERLIEVKEPLEKVLNNMEWDSLATSEWKAIENLLKLLRPFAQYTALASGEEYTTSSSVIPILMELELLLKEMQKISDILSIPHALLSQLKQRFAKRVDTTDPNHDPIYLVAAMLDPYYRILLTSDQAKAHLIKSLKYSEGERTADSLSNNDKDSTSATGEPFKKRFCYLSKIIEEKVKGNKKKKSTQPAHQQLTRYLKDGHITTVLIL